jgi:hypothetical protein
MFSEDDLRAIRRTVYVQRATSEEICLLMRPKRKGWQMFRVAWFFPILVGAAFAFSSYDKVFDNNAGFGPVLIPAYWGTLGLIVGLDVLLFFLLPLRYLPRFELILRPGVDHVTMRGFGFEQACHGGCCGLVNRGLWCNLTVDTIPYAWLRRWWQSAVPPWAGVAAIRRLLQPAKEHLTEIVANGGGQDEAIRSSSRSLWANAFGEAFMTKDEAVITLPPAGWWAWFGAIPLLFGTTGPLFWHLFVAPWHGWYGAEHHPVYALNRTPLWVPSALAFLINAIFCIWADPWFRRALAIIPRGQRRIRIRVGGRIKGEYPFWGSIDLNDQRGNDTITSLLYVRTPAWSGFLYVEPRFQECEMAVWTLTNWAEHERGSEGESHG